MAARSWCLGLVLLGVACSEESRTRRPPGGGAPAPVAALMADPASGTVPLTVSADATASTDPAGGSLEARWDFDGDGVWDTPYSAALATQVVYDVPGVFMLQVEVRSSTSGQSSSAGAEVTAIAVGVVANLDADTDRDGVVTPSDNFQEDLWSSTRGAILLANFDDDNADNSRDSIDQVVNGSGDLDDLAPLVLRRADLTQEHTVTLSVTPAAAAARVRLFREQGGGTSLFMNVNVGQASVSATDLAAGDLMLLLESTSGRTAGWDGRLTVTLTIAGAAGPVSTDSVVMRAAPTLFVDDSQPGRVLYVMRIADLQSEPNLPFYNRLASLLPATYTLYTVNEDDYWADRWVQDNMQTGYTQMPGHTQLSYLQAERDTGPFGLEPLVPSELLSADFGFAYPGGQATSLNYGGNLEIAPPHPGFPLGRTLVGGGNQGTLAGRAYEDHMTTPQREWIDAQGVQGPAVELSTEWLVVGHLDEIFVFVPDPQANGGRGWKVVLASPSLARAALVDLQNQGLGNAVVFNNRDPETTVNAILADADLMAYNQAAQTRIDSVREGLSQSLSLAPEDFLEVPVLYEWYMIGGDDFAVAYNPGVQNLVAADSVFFVPDPEGPDDAGGDVWQQQTLAALSPLGVELEFVDVFNSYHLLFGEAHCGINVDREPYATSWWEVEP